MRFQSWDEIAPTATPAELALAHAMKFEGHVDATAEYGIPTAPLNWRTAPENLTIRGEVIAFFLTGGDRLFPANAAYVQIRGALIAGTLHLSNKDIGRGLLFENCYFENPVTLDFSRIAGPVQFKECCLPNLKGRDLQISGDLFLDGTHFLDPERPVLLQSLKVSGAFHLGQKVKSPGGLNLTAAAASNLVDTLEAWPEDCQISLAGFTYDRIYGPIDAQTRLVWLAKCDRWNREFSPQPYKQLAKTLHDMGHEADAQQVLYTLATKLAAERKKDLHKKIAAQRPHSPTLGLAIGLRLRLGTERMTDFLLRSVVGYGRKPFRSLGWLIGLIALCSVIATGAWHRGDFAPNSAPILRSAEWRELSDHPNAAQHWVQTSPTGKDWESFHPLAYAADVVIPIVEFGQTEAWAPSTERGRWGYHLWWLRWGFTTLGWIVTALGAAALTGLIRRD